MPAPAQPYPSADDWTKIHAKAWQDPTFRDLLEKDPTAAVQQYGATVGKTFDRIVNTTGWADTDPSQATHPVGCC
jgi:hypothetical protein